MMMFSLCHVWFALLFLFIDAQMSFEVIVIQMYKMGEMGKSYLNEK